MQSDVDQTFHDVRGDMQQIQNILTLAQWDTNDGLPVEVASFLDRLQHLVESLGARIGQLDSLLRPAEPDHHA